MEMTENSSHTVKIAIRCLKETKCYLEYLNEIKIDKNRWKNLVSYLEFLSSLSSDRGEYALEGLIMRTITFSNAAKGAAYWSLKCSEFERKYNSLVNLYCYGLELDGFADSWFTRYKSTLWATDYEWEMVPAYTSGRNINTKLHNISKYNYIMKEFMKQTDVASEFLSFLREVNLYDVYLDEFKKEFHECGFGSKERCMKIFSEVNQNLEDYMLSLTEKEQIINLKLPIYARVLSIPKPNAYSTYGKFSKWFNAKYKDEIRKQKIIVGKLLLRYLKDNKMLMGYNASKEKKDESVTFVNVFDKRIDESPDLFSTFPQWVGISTYKILGFKTVAKISDDFRNYYIKMVNQ